MVKVAVVGTRNVINAAAEAQVRRVVFTSSIGAMNMDPKRNPDAVLDESSWSDIDFCRKINVHMFVLFCILHIILVNDIIFI